MSVSFQDIHCVRMKGCPRDADLKLFCDDALSGQRRTDFHAHIDQCSHCQKRLDQFALQADAAWDFDHAADGDVTSRIVDQLQREVPAGSLAPEDDALAADNTTDVAIDDARDLTLPIDGHPQLQGRFQLIGIAGQGGMAVVFRCREIPTGREVAVKVLRHRFAQCDDLVEQFRSEIDLQSQLGRSGVPQVIDFGVLKDGRRFLVMQYCPGETLGRWIPTSAEKSTSERLRIFEDLCEVVGAAHVAGICHRDLKPANIKIDGDGAVRVLDWGLAEKSYRRPKSPFWRSCGLELSKRAVGTPGYAAPEQVEGEMASPANDVYALGVILAELLVGKRLTSAESWDDEAANAARFQQHVMSAVHNAGVAPRLAQTIAACLRVDPDKRIQDANQLLMTVAMAEYDAIPRPQGLAKRPVSWPMLAGVC